MTSSTRSKLKRFMEISKHRVAKAVTDSGVQQSETGPALLSTVHHTLRGWIGHHKIQKAQALPRVTETGRKLSDFTVAVRNCVAVLSDIDIDDFVNNLQLEKELLEKLTPFLQKQVRSAHTALIAGKTRVAPNKSISISRLELLAVLLTFRLASTILTEQSAIKRERILFTTNRLRSLDPALIDGVLRVGGRVQHASALAPEKSTPSFWMAAIEQFSYWSKIITAESKVLWRPTMYVRNIEDCYDKNYGTYVEITSYTIERRTAHVIASPQHSSTAAPMSRRNHPPRCPSAV
ncbi:hypothetical protein EVAR_103049_1 [Eumeta japonica]|uniref:Uncharacterized protein n=1 Tax=Eumeta variegata TaxID=151549 RepID=A0A4C1WET6_EUMVA|nr:hypothetical protein EVAR_103049_1 [Eumeta japonica]